MRPFVVARTRSSVTLLVGAITLAVTTLIATPAYASPGDLDTSFGQGGKVKTAFTSGPDSALGVTIDPFGRILVAGQTHGDRFAVARYLSNGDLDPGFGTGGLVTVPAVGRDGGVYATSVAVQQDGQIVVAGQGDLEAVVVRLDTDGVLDSGFGDGGIAAAPFLHHGAVADDVALQGDGKIVIAGSSLNVSGRQFVAIARFTTAGQLDTSFSSDGMSDIAIGQGDSAASSVLIQPSDHRIVAIGAADSPSNTSDIAVVRLNTNGTLDTTFSGNGAALYTDGGGAEGTAGAITSTGHIVIAGFGASQHNEDFAVIEIGPLGHLDGNFGTGGKVLTDFNGDNDEAFGMGLQTDGKIVLAGFTFLGSNHGDDFALARYKTNGKLDETFGKDGLVTTSFGQEDLGLGMAIQSNGRIVAVGDTKPSFGGKFALARYRA